eukprot:5026476-Prymnesium_polylepis.2
MPSLVSPLFGPTTHTHLVPKHLSGHRLMRRSPLAQNGERAPCKFAQKHGQGAPHPVGTRQAGERVASPRL